MTERAKNILCVVLVVFTVIVNAYVIRSMFRAYCEEKEHAEFLYGCTNFQRPAECENQWLSQFAHGAKPPWEQF